MGHVVDAYQQEQFPGMAGQNLVQAVVHAHHLVADDAAVHHVLPAEPLAPVASVFGQAVAQHYDIFRRNGRLVHELQETFVVVGVVGRHAFLVEDGGRYGVRYQRAQAHHAVSVFGMHGVDEQDDARVRVRIDDDAGTCIACVAVSVRAEEVAVVRSVGGETVPAQCTTDGGHGAGNSAHGFHTLRTQDAPAIPLATVLEGSAEHGDVFGAGEDTCIAADASVHDAGQRVVYLSAQYLSVGLLFGRSDEASAVCPLGQVGVHPVAFFVLPARQVIGVLHVQHVENVFVGEIPERLPADGFHDVLQGDEVQAAVLEVGLRTEIARAGGNVFHQRPGVEDAVFLAQFLYVSIGWQAGSVRHQVLDADDLRFLAVFALPVLEVGEIEIYGVEHTQFTLFSQNHDTNRSRHGFAARGHVEYGGGGHRFYLRYQALITIGLQIGHLAVTYDSQHSSRYFFLGDGLVDGFVGPQKPL